MADPAPEHFFKGFEKSLIRIKFGYQTLEEFKQVENKKLFLDPTINFLETEKRDNVRSWATNLLAMIGGDKAIAALEKLLSEADTQETKREYRWTRFFALNALLRMPQSDIAESKLLNLCRRIWQDEAEDYLARSEGAAILAEKGDSEAFDWLRGMLSEYDQFWPILRSLRALQEVPVRELTDDILAVFSRSNYTDHHYQAVRALRKYPDDLKVLRELGNIVLTNENNYLRLEAVISLGRLADARAQTEIFSALLDEDAEIRNETPNGASGHTRALTCGTYFCRLSHISGQVSPGCTRVE